MKFNHFILLATLGLAACSTSPENSYYTLSPYSPAETSSSTIQTAKAESWTLVSVRVPEMLDRPQIVMKSGENGVKLLDYDRWAEPADSMITRIIAKDIATRTANASSSNSSATEHLVTVTIDELDTDTEGQVVLKATWTDQSGEKKTRGVFEDKENADASDINSSVVAMSHLLGRLSDKILSSQY